MSESKERERLRHPYLCDRAVTWLLGRGACAVALREPWAPSGEMPDAIGWNGNAHSTVIECKATRSDFLADSKKWFRKMPSMGIGQLRYYMAPPGLIAINELPAGWGLLVVHARQIRIASKAEHRAGDYYGNAERLLMFNALRRAGREHGESVNLRPTDVKVINR